MHSTGLYIHWPFCQAKCPYCDFNSHVVANIEQREWAAAYRKEIERYGAEIPDAVIGSVFFGGGTPSLMAVETVETILDTVRRTWRTTNDPEITLEANPTSVEAARFRGYRAAGVNRVSLGVQALHDEDLRRLGRRHSVAEAISAYGIARDTFERVSFDLIYARQDQTLTAWETELARALTLAADHLSLYQLTIEPGTAFGMRAAAGGMKGLPDEDLAADMYALTQDLTEDAGLPGYEISNHARPGSESRHNMIYWSGGAYIGIGPGAHGRIEIDGTRIATEAVASPVIWLSGINSGTSIETREPLTSLDVFEERVIMGLRVSDGLATSEISNKYKEIKGLVDIGLLSETGDRVVLTPKGKPLLNGVIRNLLT